MVALIPVLWAAAVVDPRIPQLLERVSEEARVFTEKSPQLLGVETLSQRGRVAPPRFRLRKGASSEDAPQVAYRTIEMVSEFRFGMLPSAPNELREIRVVTAVNQRPVRDSVKARLALTEGMASDLDRLNKQMLQDLEAYGLVGAASDAGQLIMLFRRAHLDELAFELAGAAEHHGKAVTRLSYRQISGAGARVYHREMARVKLSGELWVRDSDGMPVRVTAEMPAKEGKYSVVHRFAVDYAPSRHGVVMPAEVAYQRIQDSLLMVETKATYSDFKMFAADAEIKFLAEGDPQP